jgi:hypothetical protein
VLDATMSDPDVRRFLKERCRDAALAAVPVVILSDSAVKPEAPASPGVSGILPKPVSFDSLLQLIGRCV